MRNSVSGTYEYGLLLIWSIAVLHTAATLVLPRASGEQLLFMNPDVIAGCNALDQSLK